MKAHDYFNRPESRSTQVIEDITEIIELKLDDTITILENGFWVYADTKYAWAQPDGSDEWFADEYNVRIGDVSDIVTAVDELIEPMLPNTPGQYKISASIQLVYCISELTASSMIFADGSAIHDFHPATADVNWDRCASTVENFKCRRTS